MQAVHAIIKPFKLEEVEKALNGIGIQEFTVTEAKGHGTNRAPPGQFRGVEYLVTFLPRCMLAIVVDDDKVEPVVKAIMQAARTGKRGDGIIWITPVSGCWSIRSGEKAAQADPQPA